MIPISQRLKIMASYIPKDEVLCDIGTDHAYLPIYAVKNQITNKVIAGEVNLGPYLRAKSHIEQYCLSEFISVRHGNGLDILEINEATILTIAGMGGNLMVDILTSGIKKLSSIKMLILQPMGSEMYLRKWLYQNNYKIIDEKIIEEQNEFYEIIIAAPSSNKISITELESKFGPILLNEKNSVFKNKWLNELKKKQKVLKNIADKGNKSLTSVTNKLDIIKKDIEMIKEVLN